MHFISIRQTSLQEWTPRAKICANKNPNWPQFQINNITPKKNLPNVSSSMDETSIYETINYLNLTMCSCETKNNTVNQPTKVLRSTQKEKRTYCLKRDKNKTVQMIKNINSWYTWTNCMLGTYIWWDRRHPYASSSWRSHRWPRTIDENKIPTQ